MVTSNGASHKPAYCTDPWPILRLRTRLRVKGQTGQLPITMIILCGEAVKKEHAPQIWVALFNFLCGKLNRKMNVFRTFKLVLIEFVIYELIQEEFVIGSGCTKTCQSLRLPPS